MIKDNTNNFSKVLQSTDIENLRKSFIETLTHDLKTPILAQIRALELLLDGYFGECNSEQNEILNLTLDSCRYMYEMVATLISTYKYDNEPVELDYSYFDLVHTIENNVKKLEETFKKNNIQVIITADLNSALVSGDLIRIEKVIQTLLVNSINFAFKNSDMNIIISKKRELINVEIETSGSYINSEKMNKMFKLFTYNTEKYDKIGTGIGLYLARKIVEKHGGKIIAQSNTNKKNVLGFTIPIKAPATNSVKPSAIYALT